MGTNDPITIKRLKEELVSMIHNDMVLEGFSLLRNNEGYKRVYEKESKIELFFRCYDYKPDRVEFKLLVLINIYKIDKETRNFFHYFKEGFPKGAPTIILSETDFDNRVRHLSQLIKSTITHKVTDEKTLFHELNDFKKVLKNEILPELKKFHSLSEFQDYVLNDFNAIVGNGHVLPSLIAAKLKDSQTLKKLTDFLWVELELESKSDLHIMKKFVDNILKYSKINNGEI
jgi:hypothetical protein